MRAAREVRIGGVAVAVADDERSFWDRVERGSWEPDTLKLIADRVGPGTTFLDLGAWVGPLSLYAAALGARVLAVEADPAALADLRANVEANPALAPRIEIVAAALAPRPGPVRLGARRKPGDSMSSALLAGAAVTWTAPGVTPADLAGRIGTEGGGLFVKLDIEGGEYAVLPTFGPLLAQRPVACLVSFHPHALGPDSREREARTAEAIAPFEGFRVRPAGGTVAGLPDAAAIEKADAWMFEAA